MSDLIIDFLSNYIELSKEEIDIISKQNDIHSFKKGTLLISEGEIAKECYFVVEGCVSSYYLKNGEIKVTDFFTEKQPITPVSYITKQPSEYYIECIEDCVISISTTESNRELMRNVPRLAQLGGTVMQDQLVNQRMKHDELVKLSPEERYRNLQKTSSELLNRIPQYLIASYLGIKPESLSRIRKRLNNKSGF